MRLILLLGIASCFAADEYQFPHPKFSLLQPKGFRVSIPDEHGIQFFAFHGNVNKEMQEQDAGQFSGDIVTKSYGKWVYQNKRVKVQEGDVMNYWMFVIKNGRGHIGKRQSYTWKAEDFKKLGRKSLYHSIKKRHAYRNHAHHNHEDIEFEYGYPHPFQMRPHKFPPYHSYDDYNTHKPWPYHGTGGYHHDHHFHCNHGFGNDFDNDWTTTKKFERTKVVPKKTTTVNRAMRTTPMTTTSTSTPMTTTSTSTPMTTTSTSTSTSTPTPTTTKFPLIDVRFGE